MGKTGAVLMGLLATLATARADAPPIVPADFKVQVASFALKPEPVSTEEIVFRRGRAYLFPADSRELVIIDPARGRVELLDVGRKVQAEVTFAFLEKSLDKIKATLREAADGAEKQGGRANAIRGRMTRDLFETKLAVDPTAGPGRVRLANPSIEVDAIGEPEADAARLDLVAATLSSIAKLGAFRTPNDLPPFAELQAIAALTGDRRLRPTELAYLYRLAGPPRKFRRTYRMVDRPTDRDIQAIERVDRLREVTPSLRYERYREAR